jgi:hypothetical protein
MPPNIPRPESSRKIIPVFVLLSALLLSACSKLASFDCPTTLPNGRTPPGEIATQSHHGNEELFTVLWPEGEIEFHPSGPGEIREDGSLAMKFPWWRGEGIHGPIEVSGTRLDRRGDGVTAEMPSGYGDTGFQASALVFPSEGCWEVTARAGEAELTFVVDVVRSE